MTADNDTLYRDGGQARAVVVGIVRRGPEDPPSGDPEGHRGLKLRVPLDDGSCFDVSREVAQPGIGDWISVGDVLPVRYDLADRSNIEIDMPFLQEHLDESTYTPLGSWHPIERLRRLTDLHDHGLLSDAEFAEAQADILVDG